MKATTVILFFAIPGSLFAQALNIPWSGYAHDAQHTAISGSASQSLIKKHWWTPVDTTSPGGTIYIHYASPMITAANTALVPVKTTAGSSVAFMIRAFAAGVSGNSPSPIYTLTSDYTLPPPNGQGWTPSYSATLSLRNRLYYAGAGGTVYYRDQVDSATGPNGLSGATGQIAFYGNTLYQNNQSTFNNNVQISTPLVSDRYGNIYFGFTVSGPTPTTPPLASGVARISVTGVGSWVSAQTASGDAGMNQVPQNSVPVLSNDSRTLYFVVSDGTAGYLVSVNSVTLAPSGHVRLKDPSGGDAVVWSVSSAAPTVGPDGDLYFGVLEYSCCAPHHDRGWMLHFNSALASKTPGSFGWDSTASIVPSKLVAGYAGTSSYLILTKYNNYIDWGGDGVNKVAILDPNATMPDPVIPSVLVMKEVMTVTGVSVDSPHALPAVREWCINSAAIDPFTKSAILNSEDGNVYRWDFTTGQLSQQVNLNPPIGEAYTPTVIGPDGTIYIINDAVMYALGN